MLAAGRARGNFEPGCPLVDPKGSLKVPHIREKPTFHLRVTAGGGVESGKLKLTALLWITGLWITFRGGILSS